MLRRRTTLAGAPGPSGLRRRPPKRGISWRERVSWGLGLLVLGGGIVYLLRSVFAILFASIVFAYLLDPLVDRWEKTGRSRETGIGVIFGTAGSFIVLLVIVVVPSVTQEFIELSGNVSGYLHDITGSYRIAFFLAGYLCLQATVISAFIKEKRWRPLSAGATPT